MTLQDILDAAQSESNERQRKVPLATLKREVDKKSATRGFVRALRSRRFSVIAELKSRSPSMGSIGGGVTLDEACKIYHQHPAVGAISVLTQTAFFGGTMEHLVKVRQHTQRRPKPILRKDFIWTEYEVYFSRWIGADAILLMANVIKDKRQFEDLHALALSIGLDVLCEVHDEAEIELLPETARLCGINSRRFKGVDQRKTIGVTLRNLIKPVNHDTQTDLDVFKLFERLPSDCVRVAESGISAANIGSVLRRHAFEAALIGTSLLKSGRLEMGRQLDLILDEARKTMEPPVSVPASDAVFAG